MLTRDLSKLSIPVDPIIDTIRFGRVGCNTTLPKTVSGFKNKPLHQSIPLRLPFVAMQLNRWLRFAELDIQELDQQREGNSKI